MKLFSTKLKKNHLIPSSYSLRFISALGISLSSEIIRFIRKMLWQNIFVEAIDKTVLFPKALAFAKFTQSASLRPCTPWDTSISMCLHCRFLSGGTNLKSPFPFTFTKGGNISEWTCNIYIANFSKKAFFCNRFQ